MKKARAVTDGRGNSGTGARAVVMYFDDGDVIEHAEKLSPCTNIVAEHLAIQWAIALALEYQVTELEIFNDSQTPVYHVTGQYQVKQAHLKPIVKETWRLGSLLDAVSVQWVPREHTLRADELCREVDPEIGPEPTNLWGKWKSGTWKPPDPVPTAAEIEAARTPAGGFTKAQLAQWNVPWPPPKDWLKRLRRAGQ